MRLFISLTLSCALALLAACSPRDGGATSPGGAAQTPQASNAESPQRAQTPAPAGDDTRRITQEDLRAAMEKGGVVVFDVRDEASYGAGHIKGAKLVPWDEVEHRLGEFPKDKLLVTYCA